MKKYNITYTIILFIGIWRKIDSGVGGGEQYLIFGGKWTYTTIILRYTTSILPILPDILL